MMSKQQNELITQIGPSTPCGSLMRLYWHPAALVEELDERRPVKPVKLLGEDFVLFRDQRGCYGLLDRDCPHRGADLAFGRLEDGGLRCAFHGWLFDTEGRCLQTPAEPEGSTLCRNIRQRAFPVVERSGILFAYLGEGSPPPFPAFDCFVAPPAYTFAFKGLLECNWLQALEVGIDPAHASFLHRFFEDEDPTQGYGRQFRGQSDNTDMPLTRLLREYDRPSIEIEPADYGMQIVTTRRIDERHTHVRVTNQYFPHAFVIPMNAEMTITQWHTPIDDETCYWYAVFTSFGKPVDKQQMRAQRLELYELPEYRSRQNRSNNYGFDPHEQQHETYTGMGDDINVHDQWAVESMGRIQDRTREHLGQSDKAIIAYRKLLRRCIEQVQKGERPAIDPIKSGSLQGPAVMDGIGPSESIEDYWKEADRTRRSRAEWSTPALEPAE